MTQSENPLARNIALSALEVPVALGLGVGVFMLFVNLACAWAHCVDVSGLPWMLFGAVLGLFVAVAYWALGIHLGARWRQRLVLGAIAVAVAIGGITMPEVRQRSTVVPRPHATSRRMPSPPAAYPPAARPPASVAQ
ncbi:MAG: hypothetical protein ABI552_18790 [Casimicrobiaceae bacterium]